MYRAPCRARVWSRRLRRRRAGTAARSRPSRHPSRRRTARRPRARRTRRRATGDSMRRTAAGQRDRELDALAVVGRIDWAERNHRRGFKLTGRMPVPQSNTSTASRRESSSSTSSSCSRSRRSRRCSPTTRRSPGSVARRARAGRALVDVVGLRLADEHRRPRGGRRRRRAARRADRDVRRGACRAGSSTTRACSSAPPSSSSGRCTPRSTPSPAAEPGPARRRAPLSPWTMLGATLILVAGFTDGASGSGSVRSRAPTSAAC